VPIIGYVGGNGSGKSLLMVWDTLPTLEAGRAVLGTVRLVDYENPRDCEDERCEADPHSGHYRRSMPDGDQVLDALARAERDGLDPVLTLAQAGEVEGVHGAAHPLWIPLTEWHQVLDARGVDLLLDEVTGAASSRESSKLPAPVANKLVQLRRNDVVVRWTAPSWQRADKIIRECSQGVAYCRGMFKREVTGGGTRAWRETRLHKVSLYDAAEFDEFDEGQRRDLRAEVSEFHWGPGSVARAAYDTYDGVLTVGHVSETGTCHRCGGSRRQPACKCHA
jgi:hypothetical protein